MPISRKGISTKPIETNLKLLNLAPTFGLGHNNLAVAYYHKGEHDKAIEHADKAKELGFEVHPDFLKELEPYRHS